MALLVRRLSVVVVFALLAAAVAAPATLAAGTVKQLTDVKTTVAGPGALDDSGNLVFSGSSANATGTNPAHTFQIVRFDPVSGAATQETDAPEGVSVIFSVSDDGRYLAFPSPADLTGGNHDKGIELFVRDRTTGQYTQVTNEPAVNGGSVSAVAMAGNGNRIAFVANTDPLGTNPQNLDQVFGVDRDGNNLRQITSFTLPGSVGGVSISDDGTRLAFSSSRDLTGGNPDLGGEVFTINYDGTGLTQRTTTAATFDSGSPSLAGNGGKIAFESNGDLVPGSNPNNQTEIFVIDWAGTGLRKLTTTGRLLGLLGDPASTTPSITDDGLTVIYSSNDSRLFPPLNLDGNYEIFRIRTDGTGKTALTSSALDLGSLFPSLAGNGGRITYYSVGTSSVTLEVMDGSGGAKRTLLTFDLVFQDSPDVTPAGDRVIFTRSTGLFATGQIYSVGADGSGLAQVTNLSSGSPSSPSVAGDGRTIVFSSSADPLGTNGDGSDEIFAINIDGTGLRQLTNGAAGSSTRPVIAASGQVVVFDSTADLTGGNADASTEIFKVDIAGTGLAQLTSGIVDTTSRAPRVDASGTWLAFESNADLDGGNPDGTYEVWRVRTNGTGLQRLTGDPLADSGGADISGDGGSIVFSSEANPLGTNPEANSEVFIWSAATSSLAQLTSFVTGSSGGATISGNGAWVFFTSNAPVFETDPDSPSDSYRIPAAGGAIQRVGGLRAGAIGSIGGALGAIGGGGSSVAVGDSGEVMAFSGFGDFTGGNKDLLSEIWVIDRGATPAFEVSEAAPTTLSWSVESGPVRYDAIRGDVASLTFGGASVDLGPVLCLEKDSPDADTIGFGDATQPDPGQAFFFLYRGSQGLSDPGSYGASNDGRERVPQSGGC